MQSTQNLKSLSEKNDEIVEAFEDNCEQRQIKIKNGSEAVLEMSPKIEELAAEMQKLFAEKFAGMMDSFKESIISYEQKVAMLFFLDRRSSSV